MTAPPPASTVTIDPLYRRGLSLVLLAGCFMSIGGLGVRLIHGANEWQILFYRSLALIVTLVLVIALRSRGRGQGGLLGGLWGGLWGAFRAAGPLAAVAGLCLSVAFSAFIFSLTHTTVANTLFLLSASPFLAAILGWLILGERVRRATWLAIGAAALGVGVMVGEGLAVGGWFGLTALLSALGFAGFTVALRQGKTRDMLPAVCLAAVFTSIVTGLTIPLSAGSFDGSFYISLHDLLICIVLGAVQIGAGIGIYTIGSRHVPAAELTLLSLTEVVLGPIWVWLGVGEIPSNTTLVGGAIVLGVIAVHALSGLRRWRPPVGAV